MEASLSELPACTRNLRGDSGRAATLAPCSAVASDLAGSFRVARTARQPRIRCRHRYAGSPQKRVIARLAPGVRNGLDWTSSREPLRPFYDRTFHVSWKLHAVERNRLLAAQSMSYACDAPAHYGIAAPSERSDAPELDAAGRGKTLCSPAPWHQRARKALAGAPVGEAWRSPSTRRPRAGIVWGSDEEQMRSERIVKLLKQAIVAPRLALSESRRCSPANAVFGVDTGLTHLAAALEDRPSASTPVPIRPPPACMDRIERQRRRRPGMRPRSRTLSQHGNGFHRESVA